MRLCSTFVTMMRYNFSFALLVFLCLNLLCGNVLSQGIPIGSWRSHLSYTDGLYLAQAGDKIWVAGRYGIYTVNKNDFSTERISKVQGFSDVQAKRIEY